MLVELLDVKERMNGRRERVCCSYLSTLYSADSVQRSTKSTLKDIGTKYEDVGLCKLTCT